MEEDNGLQLSLGLSCGGSTGVLKGKEGSTSSDTKTDEGGSSNKSVGDLTKFLHAENKKQDFDNVPQSSSSPLNGLLTPPENFFTNLKTSQGASVSTHLHVNEGPEGTRYRGLWISNNSKIPDQDKSEHRDIGEKLLPEAGNKRKLQLEELNHEKNSQLDEVHSKSPSTGGHESSKKTSYISINTDDGSTAENEDAVESGAEASSSKLVSHYEDGTKRFKVGSSGSSEALKEGDGFTNSSVKDNQEQKQSKGRNGDEPQHGNNSYGFPISFQPQMTIPYSISTKLPTAPGASASGFPQSNGTQVLRPTNSERPGSQPNNPGNFPAAFGYSSVQLPVLDTGNSWNISQQLQPSYAGRRVTGITSSDKSVDAAITPQAAIQAPSCSSTEAFLYDRNTSELAKRNGEQKPREEGQMSSSKPETELTSNNMIHGTRGAGDPQSVEGLPNECSIRPGIAPGLKFGGCGSYPDLPWVTAGPNSSGRTISGVTYRYDSNQTRIVCACHGSHMSPEEFILHANSDHPNPETNAGLAALPSNNHTSSTQS